MCSGDGQHSLCNLTSTSIQRLKFSSSTPPAGNKILCADLQRGRKNPPPHQRIQAAENNINGPQCRGISSAGCTASRNNVPGQQPHFALALKLVPWQCIYCLKRDQRMYKLTTPRPGGSAVAAAQPDAITSSLASDLWISPLRLTPFPFQRTFFGRISSLQRFRENTEECFFCTPLSAG